MDYVVGRSRRPCGHRYPVSLRVRRRQKRTILADAMTNASTFEQKSGSRLAQRAGLHILNTVFMLVAAVSVFRRR